MNKLARRTVLQTLLSALSTPAWARHLRRGGVGTGIPQQAFVDINLSGTTFAGGDPVNTVIGTITPTLNQGSFTGSLAVDDTTHFKIVSGQLELATTVAAGSYPINITATQGGATNSPFAKPFTIVGSGSGTTVATITVANVSGSASPSPTPYQCTLQLDRGVLPSGQIATPTVSGSSLATWQADAQTYWDDGSLRVAVFTILLASIAGGGTVQISFVSSAGSWPNTSAITLADVTAGSDYKIAISNLHTAQYLNANSNTSKKFQFGLTIGGGVVTGGVVAYNDGTGNGTYTITQGNSTSSGSVTVTGSSVVVNSGGAGFAYEGTNGQFNAGFNAAVTLAGAALVNNYNGVRINQYRKGAACDAWRAIMPVKDATSGTVLPHLVAIFYVERWKKADGTLLAYRATVRVQNADLDTTHSTKNYTCDLDWKNGSTVIRGATNGSTGYTTLFINQLSSFLTLDSGNETAGYMGTGRMDWSANHAAYCNIAQQRAASEVDGLFPFVPKYLATFNGMTVGSALVYTSSTTGFSVSSPPSTRAAFYSTTGGEDAILALVQPMAFAAVRASEGGGGTGHNEGIFADSFILYLLALKGGYTTASTKWLAHARAAAANFCTAGNGSALLDPTTFTIPNVVKAASQTFTHMADKSAVGTTNFTSVGYTNQPVNGGSGGGSIGATLSPYHLPRYSMPVYAIEGEQWMLDNEVFIASSAMFYPGQGTNLTSTRLATLGSTSYNGLLACSYATREYFWGMMTLAGVAALNPASWADGEANSEQAYLMYQLRNNFGFMKDFYAFTGNVTINGVTQTKSADFSSSGAWGIQKYVNSSVGEDSTFIFSSYGAHMLPWAAHLHQDQGSGNGVADLKTCCNIYMIWQAGIWAFSGAHFMADGPYQAYEYPGGAPITNWKALDPANSSGWPAVPTSVAWITAASNDFADNTNAGVALSCNVASARPNVFSVSLVGGGGVNGTACAMRVLPGGLSGSGTKFVDGSAIWFSSILIAGGGGAGTSAPSPFALGTAYYIHNVSLDAGQVQQITLHATQADALTGASPITPAASASGMQVWGAPFNTLPADNSGKGTYNGQNGSGGEQRCALAYGMSALGVQYAFNAPGDTVPYPALDANVGITNAMAAAKSNTATLCTSVGVTFKDFCVEAFA